MARAVRFYQSLGFRRKKGDTKVGFTTFCAGRQSLNLTAEPTERAPSWWGRVIFQVSDVDAMHDRVLSRGLVPDFAPRDAPWGERYFHLTAPDGHQLSFTQPLAR